MTDREELEQLIKKAEDRGANLDVERDVTGYPVSVTVRHLKGVGPFPMGPIAFAERMREVLR